MSNKTLTFMIISGPCLVYPTGQMSGLKPIEERKHSTDSTVADVAPHQHGHTVRRNQDTGEKERWIIKRGGGK